MLSYINLLMMLSQETGIREIRSTTSLQGVLPDRTPTLDTKSLDKHPAAVTVSLNVLQISLALVYDPSMKQGRTKSSLSLL
jgi:hypothetical protein